MAVVRARGMARGSGRSPCRGWNRFVFAVRELRRSRRGIEAAPHVPVSSDYFGCGLRFFDFGVAVHVASSLSSAGAVVWPL
jgi:hypothetical protein